VHPSRLPPWSFGDAPETLNMGQPGSGGECGRAHIGGAETIRQGY
jgi:hypothetical protein